MYSESIFLPKRRKTRTVYVGNVPVGSDYPIRAQSMTTSSTRDVESTIEQAIRLYEAGCEIVRVTVQGIKEAEACEGIKNGLIKRGYNIPIVADIHFYPPAAMHVVDFVDKVRINPGNFVDKRASFKVIEYDDASYARELEKIEEKFTPLLEKCKRLKRSMRIGTNHGSLSDRIMNRYGDTPAGMVESALEFTRIARKNDFHDLIFSMKASNPQVMIQAYRLLTKQMYDLGWDYPIHLGVTEAGMGEDGRIKSAIGIGSLLLDGIGDTIRVSLTEDPWFEIDPCLRLKALQENSLNKGVKPFKETSRSYYTFEKREVSFRALSFHKSGTVAAHLKEGEKIEPKVKGGLNPDMVVVDKIYDYFGLKKLDEAGISVLTYKPHPDFTPILTLREAKQVRFSAKIKPLVIEIDSEDIDQMADLKPDLIIFRPKGPFVPTARAFFENLKKLNKDTPVLFSHTPELYSASAEMGSLFCDGLGEGILFDLEHVPMAFNILQASRMRTIKTDFISCPSCGRTLFDLQSVTKRIQSRTAHLAGVKIAIMGCIVNGPGEMADADFGYVGSKPGKIDLYVGKTCVEKDIEFAEADERLVELIKSHGKWVDAEV